MKINFLKKIVLPYGFSLAEILTVIAILIIIAFITVPVIKQYSSNLELNNSTKLLVSNIKLAQQNTVTQQFKYGVRLELLGRTFYLIQKEPSEQILDTLVLDEQVIFFNVSGLQDNEVIFNPTGAVDFSGFIELEHTVTHVKSRINIKPSGYVNWEKI